MTSSPRAASILTPRMSDYYKPHRKPDWNYGGTKWKLSRSRIDLFVECARCFYLDNKFGVSRPRGPAFTLNIAVDALLKKEFDSYREKSTAHPLMKKYGIKALPLKHEKMDEWRHNFSGVQCLHKPTGLQISGAVDDIWINPIGEFIVVDYKTTSKEGRVDSLSDSGWDAQYKRQMEVYQWLLRQNGHKVSNIGYFVYFNGRKDKESFDCKLEFDASVISHVGSDKWVEQTLSDIKKCLEGPLPPQNTECKFCSYIKAVAEASSTALPSEKREKEISRTQVSKTGTAPLF